MKKLASWIIGFFVIYSIFTDLTVGTLPDRHIINSTETINSQAYEEVVIKPGDTVLGLIEKRGYPDNISITEMIEDFMQLNNGIAPERIQPGETYKIPIYNNTRAQ